MPLKDLRMFLVRLLALFPLLLITLLLVVAGDWNTDLRRPGEFSDAVCSFLRELNLSLIDLCFPDSVGFTYLGHDGSKSWQLLTDSP